MGNFKAIVMDEIWINFVAIIHDNPCQLRLFLPAFSKSIYNGYFVEQFLKISNQASVKKYLLQEFKIDR